jgi:UDP:flavonoid glycosyltransferase YjiC (YdhE family)
MRITFLALGTRGDVQPLLALAVGLQQTGRHRICFAAPDNFESLVREYHLNFFPLGINTEHLIGTRNLATGLEAGRNFLLLFVRILRAIKPMLALLMERTWLSCKDAETIIYSYIGIGAYHVAEKVGVPCFMAATVPGLAPTLAYPNPSGIFPPLPFGGGYSLLTYFLSKQILQALTGSFINRWRRDKLHLPPIPFGQFPYTQLHGRPVPVLGGYSPLVVPKPSDWGEHIHVTGYWFLDTASDWQPPVPLVEFLVSGSSPVYVGFGSMANRNPWQTTRLILDALDKSRQRGILSAGWGGLHKSDFSANVFTLDAVPHAWLFPRVSAVVHHGGSGTTGAGLRAGVPSVLVPHIGDQPFWAQRVVEMGVGPKPIPRSQLTARRLAEAITDAVRDTGMQARALSLGERIRAEDGIEKAVEIIESYSQ